MRENLLSKLLSLLQTVDAVPVTGKQKLLLYKAGICPRIMWDLTISRFSPTWVMRTLEAEANKSLKKWVGLARSASPAALYLPKSKGGMGVTSISGLFKKQQVSHAAQLISSRDPVVRYSATQMTISEQQKQCASFKPLLVARDALMTDPGMSSKKLSKVSRALVMEEEAEERLSTMLASEHRGEAVRTVEDEAASQWALALDSLSPFALKFALNACQDTLPHNANLSLWNGHPGSCKLCGERQTLLHILCNCSVALNLRRYNNRHDEVLRVIHNFLKEHLNGNQSILADLHDHPTYVFPPHIAKTDQRPDIVIWNDSEKSVSLLEITVCHESNFVEAHQRKVTRYLDLEQEIRQSHYRVKTTPIQVGCCGFIDIESFERMKDSVTCSINTRT